MFEIVPVAKPVHALIFMAVDTHGDNGTSTAYSISVSDGDDIFFLLVSIQA